MKNWKFRIKDTVLDGLVEYDPKRYAKRKWHALCRIFFRIWQRRRDAQDFICIAPTIIKKAFGCVPEGFPSSCKRTDKAAAVYISQWNQGLHSTNYLRFGSEWLETQIPLESCALCKRTICLRGCTYTLHFLFSERDLQHRLDAIHPLCRTMPVRCKSCCYKFSIALQILKSKHPVRFFTLWTFFIQLYTLNEEKTVKFS